MAKLIEIEFVCENCEVVVFEVKDSYYHVIMGKTHKSYDSQHGDFFENEGTEYAKLIFDLNEFRTNLKKTEDIQDPLKRLEYKDCTSVVFKFDDGQEKQIYVPWKGWSMYGSNHLENIQIKRTSTYEHFVIEFNGRSLFTNLKLACTGFLYSVFVTGERFFRNRRIRRK